MLVIKWRRTFGEPKKTFFVWQKNEGKSWGIFQSKLLWGQLWGKHVAKVFPQTFMRSWKWCRLCCTKPPETNTTSTSSASKVNRKNQASEANLECFKNRFCKPENYFMPHSFDDENWTGSLNQCELKRLFDMQNAREILLPFEMLTFVKGKWTVKKLPISNGSRRAKLAVGLSPDF